MDDRRRLELAGWALAAVVAVLIGARMLAGGGGAEAAPVALKGPGEGGSRSAGRGGRLLVVDVDGEVRRPGVARVPAGSRVDAAVRRAGGLTPRADAGAINLAAPLQDGQQVVVPRRGADAAAPAAAGSPDAAGAPAQPISLATATVAQLDTVDGIGPTLAQRIVDYRDERGGFRSIAELQQVDGIGEARFEALREAVQP